jgi:hypothetical protein
MQNLGKQGARHCHLGQLEHHVAAMAHDPCADLDQLLAQGRERPMLDLPRQGQRAQEVAEVVGERMELKSDRIGGERPARQPRPPDRALALFT